jgi:hypothetical protein
MFYLSLTNRGIFLKDFLSRLRFHQDGEEEQQDKYIHSAEMVTDNYGRRSVAAGWVLGNRELILDHVHPKE